MVVTQDSRHAWDMTFLKAFVTVGKHFTYSQLNRNISASKCAGNDANSKPCEVQAEDNVWGRCRSELVFLRLLPLLIGDGIKNPVMRFSHIFQAVCRHQLLQAGSLFTPHLQMQQAED